MQDTSRVLVAVLLALALAAGCAPQDADESQTGEDAPAATEVEPADEVPDAEDGAGEPAPAADDPADPPQDGPDGDADGATGEEPAPDDGAPPPEEEDEEEEEPEPEGPPSDERTLELATRISGGIAPKSVVASGAGRYVAQNMMYMHTVTVYDDDHELVAEIPDRVDLADFGHAESSTEVRGAPVEAAFTSDGAHAYISNYSMFGPGFDNPGSDSCSPDEGRDDSFVYRLDMESLEFDQVIAVGSTPKYVAVTPDDRYVLVSNWCSYDLSVIDVEEAREVERIDLGRYPRGIAVTPDAATAYVAVMGSTELARIDLDDLSVDRIPDVGDGPRHLVMAPDADYLYITLNRDGVVAKLDLETDEVVATVATGEAPRSMDIAADGRSLYIVNYHSDTVSKVATESFEVLQDVNADLRPIGITYDPLTSEVWVSCYSGTIMVFEDA